MKRIVVMDKAKEHKRAIVCAGVAAVAIVLVVALVSCSASRDEAEGSVGIASAAPSSTSYPQDGDPAEAVMQESEKENAGEPVEAASDTGNSRSTSPIGDSGHAEAPSQSIAPISSGDTSPEAQKRWVEDTEQIWVVDRAAWTETKPVYETRERSICNICGADITGNTAAHNKAHMLAGEGSGYHSEVQQVQVGTETINHPEEGHWETKVVGGHWE